jgi:hypothetical protein
MFMDIIIYIIHLSIHDTILVVAKETSGIAQDKFRFRHGTNPLQFEFLIEAMPITAKMGAIQGGCRKGTPTGIATLTRGGGVRTVVFGILCGMDCIDCISNRLGSR